MKMGRDQYPSEGWREKRKRKSRREVRKVGL